MTRPRRRSHDGKSDSFLRDLVVEILKNKEAVSGSDWEELITALGFSNRPNKSEFGRAISRLEKEGKIEWSEDGTLTLKQP